MTDYSKLEDLNWLKDIPRVMTPEIESVCNEICPKPAFFVFWGGGQKGWLEGMKSAELHFVYVIQANQVLLNPSEPAFAPAVFLATPNVQGRDSTWILETGKALTEKIQDGAAPEIQSLLDDEQSNFDINVPSNLTGEVPCKMWVEYLDSSILPNGRIPETKVIPALKHGKRWSIIPSKFYS